MRTGFNGMIIQRAKEWNDALSQYCDDMGLTGEEMEQLVKIHLASPLARCGNPTCDEFEVKVKGFAKCSRCNRINRLLFEEQPLMKMKEESTDPNGLVSCVPTTSKPE